MNTIASRGNLNQIADNVRVTQPIRLQPLQSYNSRILLKLDRDMFC